MTNLGYFLRKIRREHNDLIGDMANKLYVTPVVITDFEIGRKIMDEYLIQLLISKYNLNEAKQIELREYIRLDRRV